MQEQATSSIAATSFPSSSERSSSSALQVEVKEGNHFFSFSSYYYIKVLKFQEKMAFFLSSFRKLLNSHLDLICRRGWFFYVGFVKFLAFSIGFLFFFS